MEEQYTIHNDPKTRLTEIKRGQRQVTSFASVHEINHLSDANLTDLVIEMNFLLEELHLLRRRLSRHYDY